jgi:hypothetical protein
MTRGKTPVVNPNDACRIVRKDGGQGRGELCGESFDPGDLGLPDLIHFRLSHGPGLPGRGQLPGQGLDHRGRFLPNAQRRVE